MVLTRNYGYRKHIKDIKIPSFFYRKYPNLREALSRRCAAYNEQLALVERLEDEGKIIAVRPVKPIVVTRVERDAKKLHEFYEEGYQCGLKAIEKLGVSTVYQSVSCVSY